MTDDRPNAFVGNVCTRCGKKPDVPTNETWDSLGGDCEILAGWLCPECADERKVQPVMLNGSYVQLETPSGQRVVVKEHNGRVWLDLGSVTNSVTMLPGDALSLAEILVRHARMVMAEREP